MSKVLSYQAARRAYDRIGLLQDTQAFYEDRATDMLLRNGDFAAARNVFEFGCGTGRFARRLFSEFLPPGARYRGTDISPRMVSIARRRVAPFTPRAEIIATEGGAPVDEPAESYDRFVSNYVFDLLSEEDIRNVLQEARRMLGPGGLICLAGLSTGVDPFSRSVASVLSWIQARRPAAVGGCRPIDLRPFLATAAWQVLHHDKFVAFGITSEALVAQRR